ncbi:EI24 domain-containing protein [Roseomonas elaeocarpi]|uniref:EI24 domain-containing protein n=1 Tax=Roseomonas elaeocarpi TaxID=907779 RepID=A0ABV6JT35_9PROT
MPPLLRSLILPLRQLDDRSFRNTLLKGLFGALFSFVAVVFLADWGVSALVGGSGWIATVAGWLGGLLVLASAVWLFVPVALAISGLCSDAVAEAVERRFYPGLPPARGASLAAQARFNIVLSLQVLVINLVLLPLGLFLPLIGAVLFWVVAAVSLGNGMFEGVAQRRMTVAEARALRRQRRFEVLALGGALAALALVPVANLLVPILGTAAMTHLLHRNEVPVPSLRAVPDAGL